MALQWLRSRQRHGHRKLAIGLPRRRKQDNDGRVIDRHELITRLLPAAPERYRAIIAIAAGLASDGVKSPDSVRTRWISTSARYA